MMQTVTRFTPLLLCAALTACPFTQNEPAIRRYVMNDGAQEETYHITLVEGSSTITWTSKDGRTRGYYLHERAAGRYEFEPAFGQGTLELRENGGTLQACINDRPCLTLSQETGPHAH